MEPIFYPALLAGSFLCLWGVVVKNTGGVGSLVVVKLLPAGIGIWCLFECARVMA